MHFLDLAFDLFQFALGAYSIWFGVQSLRRPQGSWAGDRLTKAIKENWAGSTTNSHRNLAIGALTLGLIICLGMAASWILRFSQHGQ
jgi:hypothetical protein